jgi:RimJ/RimL family protein N-acetyltransferase
MKSILSNIYYQFKPSRIIFFQFQGEPEWRENELLAITQSNFNSELPVLNQVANLAQESLDFIANRIEQGHTLFLSIKDRVLVGYFWYSAGPIEVPWEKSLKLSIDACNGYIWDCKVSPQYRNQGIYRHAITEIVRRVEKSVQKNIFIYCNVMNLASRTAIIHSGFTPIQSCIVIPLPLGAAFLLTQSRFRFTGPRLYMQRLFP